MKKKENKILNALIISCILIFIIITFFYIQYSNGITLIQLHDNSTRQMMGYILITKNKTIVIDGGLKEDSQNLVDTNIKIGKVYVTLNDLDWYKQYEVSRIEEIERFFTIIKNDKIKDIVEEVSLNQIINIDNLKCEILGIKNPEITTNPINNSSMIIKMNIHNKSILFLADTGKESGEKLLKNQANKLKSDIVQMAHHGQAGVTNYKA